MSKPRVLFLDHSGALGGAELYLLDVARHFRKTSRVILFESGPFADRLREHEVPLEIQSAPAAVMDIEKSAGWSSALKALPGLTSLTLRVSRYARNFDVLYANSQKSLFVAGLAGTLARRPVIWNLHDLLTPDHFSSFNRWAAIRWANWFVDRVVVNSEATREAFVHEGGNRDKTGLVYNGFDATPFDSVSSEAASAVRQDELGVDQEVPVLGVFSRLAPWKGQHVAIQALSQIPEAHLLLVGDALFEDEDGYTQKLETLCTHLGVEDRVHFLGFRQDVPCLMKAVDIVVHASTAPEPFGRVIVEGMLACTPVVATRAGGAVEIVEDKRTGRLAPPGDETALAECIREMLESRQERMDMVRRAREMAQERFSLDTMLNAVDEQIRRTTTSEAVQSDPE